MQNKKVWISFSEIKLSSFS